MAWYRHLLALVLLAVVGRAEGLVQLTLTGAVPATEGGRIEVSLDLQTSASPIVLELDVFLAGGTQAPTLAQWIHEELKSAGASSILSIPNVVPGEVPRADLILPRATRVLLRLAPGMSGRITLCKGPPLRVRLHAAKQFEVAAGLQVLASTQQPLSEKRSTRDLHFPMPSGAHPAQLAADLFQFAHQAGWSCERPADDLWQPVQMNDGARIVGCTLFLTGQSDHALEVEL